MGARAKIQSVSLRKPSCRVAFAAVLAALWLASCESTRPEPPAVFLEVVDTTAAPGERVELRARVIDVNGVGLPDIPVRWRIDPSAPPLEQTFTNSDLSGFARVGWTAPPYVSAHVIVVTAGTAEDTLDVTVEPPAVHAVQLSRDSVHWTVVQREERVTVQAFDADGRDITNQALLYVTTTGPFQAAIEDNSIRITALPALGFPIVYDAKATGEVAIFDSPVDRRLLGRVKLVRDAPVVSFSVAGGFGAEGVAETESRRMDIDTRDSAGTRMAVDASDAGILFSTSDAAIASVDSDGVVTGVSPGVARLSAWFGTDSAAFDVEVVPHYDLGAMTEKYAVPFRTLYSWAEDPVVHSSGASLMATYSLSRPASNLSSAVRLSAPDGTARWSRSAPGPMNAVFLPGGDVVVAEDTSRTITAVDQAGAAVWSRSIRGSVIADSIGVLVLSSVSGVSVLRALSAAGDSLWAYSAAQMNGVTPAMSLVYVRVGETLQGVDRAGAVLWTRPYPGPGITDETSTYLAVSHDAPGPTATLQAIDPASGATRWTRTLSTTLMRAGGPGNTFIVASLDSVRLLDGQNGATLWSVPLPSQNVAISAISVGDKVLIGAKYIHVYAAATGEALGRTATPLTYGVRLLGCTSAGLLFLAEGDLRGYERCQ